jgi:tetratricopeptide (TPR) repeat protein
VAQNRRSEAVHLQDWMEIAFGKAGDEAARPIDLRLHTRFAEVYLKSGEYVRAVEQLQLARQLAPRDIYVLRTLGRALLEVNDPGGTEEVVERIGELDPTSFARNVECAALLARLNRESGRTEAARGVLMRALENNATSYYLANLLAETCLELQDVQAARAAFRRALDIIKAIREDNIWVNATAANSAFALGQDEEALEYVAKIAAKHPDDDALQSIERGLRTVAAHVAGESRLDALLDTLRPDRVQARVAYRAVSS